MSEPAESLAEPFELLAGPAMPHVDLVSGVTPVVQEPDDDGPDVEAVAAPARVPPSPVAQRPVMSGLVTSGLVMSGPVAAGQAASARVASGRLVSGRGVTGRGIVVLILLVTGIVGLIEVALAGHRGHAFAIAFVATSVIGALVVRRRDLPTAIIAPPLLYCVLIVAMSAVDTSDETGGLLTREGVYIGNAFVTGAPAVWAGTAAAVLIAWYRSRASASRVAPAKSVKQAKPTNSPVEEMPPPAT